jgi:hypothetical protein
MYLSISSTGKIQHKIHCGCDSMEDGFIFTNVNQWQSQWTRRLLSTLSGGFFYHNNLTVIQHITENCLSEFQIM